MPLRVASTDGLGATGQPRKSVDAFGVLLGPILSQSFRTLRFGPGREATTLPHVLELRNAEATGVAYACDVCDDDRPRPGVLWKPPNLGVPFFSVGNDDSSLAMQADDLRGIRHLTEHEHDPPVLLKVRNRFSSAASEVKVGDRPRVKNPERVQSLG